MLALAATTFFTSCSSDDDIPDTPEQKGEYANGIFVLNEGNFQAGNASVSFVDESLENVIQNVFSRENDGDPLGDTAQSMAFFEEYAFIVVNVSNKVEVVDRNTFERVATLDEGLVNPRYVAFSNGNAYVTNWGDGGNPDDDYVAVIDLESFEVEENIGVQEGPDKIIAEGGNLYVAHLGGWSFNNKISVINASNNTLEDIITVGDLPNSMAISNGSLWVSSAGLPSYSENESAGSIAQIDLATLELVEEFAFTEPTEHPSNLVINEGIVYYTLGNAVYAFDTTADALPEDALFELEGISGIRGFEIQDSRIFVASPGADYSGDGTLNVYDLQTGELITEIEVGIIPNGVYFNN